MNRFLKNAQNAKKIAINLIHLLHGILVKGVDDNFFPLQNF